MTICVKVGHMHDSAITPELIAMPIVGPNICGPMEPCVRCGTYRHYLANMIE